MNEMTGQERNSRLFRLKGFVDIRNISRMIHLHLLDMDRKGMLFKKHLLMTDMDKD
jgi:hypothetical protein